ncbi:hypothetical protein Ahy_B06g083597 isoform C [Arachis hypogaea]|uniref:Uncharacterized protein n=1 Tax=Arachis hypogaea TaxID=3818 RepID=A0A444YQ76_ARAHY|nr:hypothetical protein Ahy_B06g083597 isoform C [Arachis hypogaea]
MWWMAVATIVGTLVAFLIVPMRSLGSDNWKIIAALIGIESLIDLLGSKNASIQHNVAFALYGLVDNEVQAKAICSRALAKCVFSGMVHVISKNQLCHYESKTSRQSSQGAVLLWPSRSI